jgi:hypothetical protein
LTALRREKRAIMEEERRLKVLKRDMVIIKALLCIYAEITRSSRICFRAIIRCTRDLLSYEMIFSLDKK